ncbi:MAG: SDR family oxidoreductase [Verrucomicrobiaceae bacterium]
MRDRFKVGMVFHEDVCLSPALVESFAAFSGDRNPLHLVKEAAVSYGFARPVAHGAIQSAVVSRLIGMKVPGPGAVWMNQSMEWLRPAFVGETLRIEAEIETLSEGAEVMVLALRATNEQGERVMQGSAKVKVAATVAARADKDSARETRVALVTGGSRGIGAAIAKALSASGMHVAIAYRSAQGEAQSLAAELEQGGNRAQCFSADFMEQGSATGLVQEVKSQLGRLDVIVHAATAPLPSASALEASISDLRDSLKVHVETAWELAQAAAPEMMERRFGRLIFMGTSALFGAPPSKLSSYVIAKQALWGITRCLAVELGPHQITANLISPGMTVTDLTANVPQRIKEAEARKVPVRRLAVPDDAAALAAFLASDDSSYVNGQNIPLTGGPV